MSANEHQYNIEGESLTLNQIRARLVEMGQRQMSKSTLRSRVVSYGWRTWAQLQQTTKLGARSPWRRYRDNWLSGGDRKVLPHYRENGG